MKWTLSHLCDGPNPHRAYVETIITPVAHAAIRWNLEADPTECESWYRHESGWYLR